LDPCSGGPPTFSKIPPPPNETLLPFDVFHVRIPFFFFFVVLVRRIPLQTTPKRLAHFSPPYCGLSFLRKNPPPFALAPPLEPLVAFSYVGPLFGRLFFFRNAWSPPLASSPSDIENVPPFFFADSPFSKILIVLLSHTFSEFSGLFLLPKDGPLSLEFPPRKFFFPDDSVLVFIRSSFFLKSRCPLLEYWYFPPSQHKVTFSLSSPPGDGASFMVDVFFWKMKPPWASLFCFFLRVFLLPPFFSLLRTPPKQVVPERGSPFCTLNHSIPSDHRPPPVNQVGFSFSPQVSRIPSSISLLQTC